MKNKNVLVLIISVIFVFSLVSSINDVSGVAEYPYSVKIGDKISYHIDILKNGTNKGPINIYGLNFSQGDNFKIEVFTGVAKSTSYVGTDYTIKFLKGDQESIAISGSSYLYTSNKTFWEQYKNTTQDIGGQVYELTRLNDTITYSWTKNADNFIKIEFNANDGLIRTYEQATTSSPYNYTHFKFSKGTGGLLDNIPGFDISTGILTLFVLTTFSLYIKKRKN